jgi:hypothetical protein
MRTGEEYFSKQKIKMQIRNILDGREESYKILISAQFSSINIPMHQLVNLFKLYKEKFGDIKAL